MKLNIFILSFLLVISLVIFSACTHNTVTKSIDYGNLSHLAPFIEAGCHIDNTTNSLNCFESDLKDKFPCDYSSYRVFESNSFDKAIVSCSLPIYDFDGNRLLNDTDSYFYCDGGLYPICQSYITFDEDKNEFILIKNQSDIHYLGPIDTSDKALSLVMLSYSRLKLTSDNGKLKAKSTKDSDGNYLVTVFGQDSPFGCYSEINYYSLDYKVFPDGTSKFIDSKVIKTEKLDGEICAD